MKDWSQFETIDISFAVSKEANLTEADLEDLAQRIETRFQKLAIGEKVEAVPEEARFITGAEVAMAIGVTIAILRGSRIATHELRLLLQEIKALVNDIKGLKSASVKVGEKELEVDEADEKGFQELLEKVTSDKTG